MAVTLRYFTEIGKLALQKTICGGIYARVLYYLVRVQCRRKESSRSLSHLLMSFLFFFGGGVIRWQRQLPHRVTPTLVTPLYTQAYRFCVLHFLLWAQVEDVLSFIDLSGTAEMEEIDRFLSTVTYEFFRGHRRHGKIKMNKRAVCSRRGRRRSQSRT